MDLSQLLDSLTLADKGYAGLELATPTKREPGQRLRAGVKGNSRVINCLRSVVERVIAHIKTRRVLHTGFRRVFAVVRGLVFLVGSYE